MRNFIPVLRETEIMAGLTDEEIVTALTCFEAAVRQVQSGGLIFSEGDAAVYIGIVLSGAVTIQRTDYYGNVNIVMTLLPGDMFGESAAQESGGTLPFDVVCEREGAILLIDNSRLLSHCPEGCRFHHAIIENLLRSIAKRNVRLTAKIQLLTMRTLRERILAYLSTESGRAKRRTFTVPLNRNRMADYLSCDRSALSRELSIMRESGLIDYNGREFTLL